MPLAHLLQVAISDSGFSNTSFCSMTMMRGKLFFLFDTGKEVLTILYFDSNFGNYELTFKINQIIKKVRKKVKCNSLTKSFGIVEFCKFLFENNLHVMSNSNEISVLYYTHSVFMCKL